MLTWSVRGGVGHDANIDAVAMLNEEAWVSGSQDGTISLWHATKKKPAATMRHSQLAGAIGGADPAGDTTTQTAACSGVLVWCWWACGIGVLLLPAAGHDEHAFRSFAQMPSEKLLPLLSVCANRT